MPNPFKKPALPRKPLNPRPADVEELRRKLEGPVKLTPMTKKAKANRLAALKSIRMQFPAANAVDLAIANRPEKPKHKVEKEVDQFYLRPKDGRVKLAISGRTKKIKLKEEIWSQRVMMDFIMDEGIHADNTQWFICSNTEGEGKLTASSQVTIMLNHNGTEYRVQINRPKRHLIIESYNGSDDI